MTVARAKGAKGKADRLFSLLVRDRGVCEARTAHDWGFIDWHSACVGAVVTAHIVGRGYATTRTEFDNALALCANAHLHFDSWADDKVALTDAIYGEGHYADVKRRANEGVGTKVDWKLRADTLERLAQERGLL